MGRGTDCVLVEGLPDVVFNTGCAGTWRIGRSDCAAVYAAPAPPRYSRIEYDAVAAIAARPRSQRALAAPPPQLADDPATSGAGGAGDRAGTTLCGSANRHLRADCIAAGRLCQHECH